MGSSYSKSYYESHKVHISSYNKARRKSNPDVILKEKEGYKQKSDEYKIRSKIQNLRGRLAFESLSQKKQKEIMDIVNNMLDT